MKKKTVYIGLLLILLIGAFVFFCCDLDKSLHDTLFFAALESIGALFGIFGLLHQEIDAKELESAKFIVEMNQNYINDDKHQELISYLEKTNGLVDFNDKIKDMIIQHLDFFEPIYLLVERKIVDLDLIDDLFGYRFFRVVNDVRVQETIINPNVDCYKNIIQLHYIWKKHRNEKKQALVPCRETDLSQIPCYNDLICSKKVICINENHILNTETCNTGSIVIREVQKSDAQDICRLYDLLLNTQSKESNIVKYLKRIKKQRNNYILVATEGSKVVGTIQVTICDSAAFQGRPHGVIEYFIVDINHRRNGIGTKLFQAAEKICTDNNVSCILIVSSENRTEAHTFYKNNNYDDSVKGFRKDF